MTSALWPNRFSRNTFQIKVLSTESHWESPHLLLAYTFCQVPALCKSHLVLRVEQGIPVPSECRPWRVLPLFCLYYCSCRAPKDRLFCSLTPLRTACLSSKWAQRLDSLCLLLPPGWATDSALHPSSVQRTWWPPPAAMQVTIKPVMGQKAWSIWMCRKCYPIMGFLQAEVALFKRK